MKPGFDKSEIHDFRVSYKQLRALLRMLLGGEPGNPFSKSVQKLYRAAGKVRDLQLFLHRAQGSNEAAYSAAKTAAAKQALAKASEKLSRRLEKALVKHADWSVPALLPPVFTNMNARAFAAREWSALASALALADDDEQLHTIRKKLKDLYYANDALKGYSFISPGLILRLHEPGALKKCTEALDDWQNLITSKRIGAQFMNGPDKGDKHKARLADALAAHIQAARRKALTLVRETLFTGEVV